MRFIDLTEQENDIAERFVWIVQDRIERKRKKCLPIKSKILTKIYNNFNDKIQFAIKGTMSWQENLIWLTETIIGGINNDNGSHI